MNNYFDALLQLENKTEELGMLLAEKQNAHAINKIDEIEAELKRLKNWAWKHCEALDSDKGE